MSKAGKILLFLSVVFFIALCVMRIVLGGWETFMWVPLALSLALCVAAVVKDRSVIKEFFFLKTTKHGMNMGVLILLVLTGLICLNFLAFRYEKKFDWTSEKLNSLSEQSVKAAEAMKAKTELVLVYRKEEDEGRNFVAEIRELARMYENASEQIKFVAYNALQRPDLQVKYEFRQGPFVFYATQGDRQVKIESPPTEQEVTRALLKLGRDRKKVVYFVSGHGEKPLDGQQPFGLSQLREYLQVTYDVRGLTLFDQGYAVPEDAAAVAVIGPEQQFLEAELRALREYARKGGSLFLALDPGVRHNLALLTKPLGVEYANNYVLDLRSRSVPGAGPAVVLGTEYSASSEITRAFQSPQFTIFNLASAVREAPGAPETFTFERLVETDASTMSVDELRDQIAFRPNGPHVVAALARGTLSGAATDDAGGGTAEKAGDDKAAVKSGAKAESKEFQVVVVGDSDFATNALFGNNLNRDLALNSFAALMKDNDLISIRPKAPKGTKLELPQQSFLILAVVWFGLPLLLFSGGGFVWWRRRTA